MQPLNPHPYNKLLQLCTFKDVSSSLHYDRLMLSTTIGDTTEALNRLFKGVNIDEYELANKATQHELDTIQWDTHKRLFESLHQVAFGHCITQLPRQPSVNELQQYANDVLFPSNAAMAYSIHTIHTPPPTKTPHIRCPKHYRGGYHHITTTTPPILSPLDALDLAQYAIYFPVPGLSHSSNFVFHLLSNVLGGGSAFSAGGPGKGIYSRLFQAMCHTRGIEKVQCHHYQYEQLSLFGITLTCEKTLAPSAFSFIMNQLMRLYHLEDREIERSKNQTLSKQFTSLEESQHQSEFHCMSSLYYKTPLTYEAMSEGIRSIQLKDIRDALQSLLQAPPTVLKVGRHTDYEDPYKVFDTIGLPLYKANLSE